jgi:hypothetical protein
MEKLFDRPARQVLADARRAMDANRDEASGGLQRPDRIEPETDSGEEVEVVSGIQTNASFEGNNVRRIVFRNRLGGDPRPLIAPAGCRVLQFPAGAVRRKWAW